MTVCRHSYHFHRQIYEPACCRRMPIPKSASGPLSLSPWLQFTWLLWYLCPIIWEQPVFDCSPLQVPGCTSCFLSACVDYILAGFKNDTYRGQTSGPLFKVTYSLATFMVRLSSSLLALCSSFIPIFCLLLSFCILFRCLIMIYWFARFRVWFFWPHLTLS